MFDICQEVQRFISVCEALQSFIMQGRTLTSDEKDLIEFEARDLLTKLQPTGRPPSDVS
jgi:hypothetical protein